MLATKYEQKVLRKENIKLGLKMIILNQEI